MPAHHDVGARSVPFREEATGMKIREILFATDFSSASESAGKIARELALKMGARLHAQSLSRP
jgi:hypothetical protein